MSHTESISIITPSLNQGTFIERTIRSVQDQEVALPVEYIVVDGGSTDNTLDILKRYSDRIRWVSEKDSGQSDALNKGIAMASGSIIGYLNSDDIYLPGALQKIAGKFVLHPKTNWVYGMAKMIDDQEKETRKWISWYKSKKSGTFKYNRLLVENYISQPAVFFRKEAFYEAGGFDLSLHYAMDYDLWIRLARISPPLVLQDDLAAFRIQSQSKSIKNYKKLFREQYQVHQRYDKNRWRLFKHRMMIAAIQMVYRILKISFTPTLKGA